jgi:ADP-ribose pyrophosphatase
MKHWKTLSSEKVFDTFWVGVRKDAVELGNGMVLDDFYVIERRDFVVVFGLTPDNEVVLVRQFKYGVRQVLLELPAGFIEDGEPPENAAAREFEEETGYHSDNIIPLASLLVGPSNMNHTAYAYLALDAVPAGSQHLDTTEDIEVQLMPLPQLTAAVTTSEINCMSSVAVAFLALQKLNELKLLKP